MVELAIMQEGKGGFNMKEPGGAKAPLPDHACMILMMGLSEVYGEHVVILGKLRGAHGKWVPFGGKKEPVDKGGKHTAMREVVEEFFGIESDGAARGELLLQEAERAGAMYTDPLAAGNHTRPISWRWTRWKALEGSTDSSLALDPIASRYAGSNGARLRAGRGLGRDERRTRRDNHFA